MSEKTNNDSGTPPAKKMFTFRQSALAAKADQLWSQSKSGSTFGTTPTHVHLEKKSLDDVLGRMAAEKRLRQELEDKGQQAFVFGSKISDRVLKTSVSTSENGNPVVEVSNVDSRPRTAEELFQTAAQQEKQREDHDFFAEAKEAAEKKKEHERPSTSLIAVTTGEENDTACKLHSFDTEKKTWVERGLAQIKINRQDENGEIHHRIVARTTGNHRLIINSKVHADMLFERVDSKRLKISATTPDSNTMQIFLVTIGFSARVLTDNIHLIIYIFYTFLQKTAFNTDEFCTTLENVIKLEQDKADVHRKRRAAEGSPGSSKVPRLCAENSFISKGEHSTGRPSENDSENIDEGCSSINAENSGDNETD
ncbi:RanBP1 domain protein [Dictyocaulus viviparus]|uniref:RanBP1 domain protein n=1 Tax=Dictyocaulus viviparus TaxID=29172 RepID=A0A0D8XXE7_DICVI|nr:RanBP1 domain protein [Dictyocaulus viviparus]